jgi:hypothetical protein
LNKILESLYFVHGIKALTHRLNVGAHCGNAISQACISLADGLVCGQVEAGKTLAKGL